MLRKLLIGVGGLGLVVGVVIAIKTAVFAPAGIADASAIKVAAAPVINVNQVANHLSQAIRFQTVSRQNAAENKIEEWTKFGQWLQSTYPLTHGKMRRAVVGSGTLVYEWPGSDARAKPIILMAHQDVVPVTPGTEKDWKYPPFEGRVAENAVWGRGAVDDKGSLIGLFESLELLAHQGFAPKRTLWLVSGHDEEVGGGGAIAAAQYLASRKVKALFTLDEGSAIVADAPIIDAPAVLIGIAEKGYATLKVSATAKGGHSSMPPDEIATINLAKAVIAIHAKPFQDEINPPVSGMMETLAARKGGMIKVAVANQWLFAGQIRTQFAKSPAGAAMLRTTIAPTMLEGSPKENVLPQSATALINYRIAPWNSSADVMARAKAAVGTLPVELSWLDPPREASAVSSTQSQGWSLIRAAAQAEAPGAVVAPYLVVAGTDSRNMESVSDDVYRFMPMTLAQKETGMIHGTNEHATLKNLELMVRFFTRLIATSAG